jgi:hypothetical protein
MTTPTTHTVALKNRFGNAITAPVVFIKDLGDGRAEVHLESNFYIEAGHAHPAIYATPGHEAKGRYKVTTPLKESEFTERQTYIYKGTFQRAGS